LKRTVRRHRSRKKARICCQDVASSRTHFLFHLDLRFLARSTLPTRDVEIFHCLVARIAEKKRAQVDFQAVWAHRRQPCPPHLSRISLHFGCISQTIAFSKVSHDRPADVVICKFRCMDSLQSNVIRLTGCGEVMYNLIHLFPTSFMP